MEAMSLKLPVLAFNNTANKSLTEGNASYFLSSEEVNVYLKNTSIEKMRKNAAAMGEISSRRFKWKAIAEKYEFVIHELLILNSPIELSQEIKRLKKPKSIEIINLKYQHLFLKR